MKGVTNVLSRGMNVYKNMHTFWVIQSNFKSTSTCMISTKIVTSNVFLVNKYRFYANKIFHDKE